MKKFYLTAFAMAASLPMLAWTSAGDGTTYTFADLAELTDQVTAIGQLYNVGDITISAGDVLKLQDGDDLLLSSDAGPEARITILGHADFAPEGHADISNAYDAPMLSILIDGDGTATFANVKFTAVGVLSSSTQGITVRDCQFGNMMSEANSTGAIAFTGQSAGNVIDNCSFANCQVPAIGSAANSYCGMAITNCIFSDCNQDNSNKPMINITQPGANGPTVISGCTITGAKRNKVGGLSVSDLLSGEAGDVTIEGNAISDCRYGINLMGPMNVVVRDNKLSNNIYESNPLNGGSGLSATAYSGRMNLIVSGNEIKGNLWGVTLISYALFNHDYYQGFNMVSLGQPDNADIDSPGNNVFGLNGNDGAGYDPATLYDLYNNTGQTVYAQNNTWSADDPDECIYDQSDDAILGQVIYEPVHEVDGIKSLTANCLSYDAATAAIICPVAATVEIYALDGKRLLTRSNAQIVSVSSLQPGLYLARTTCGSIKFRKQ